MQLGTLWGLTAPMLLLAYDSVDEIAHVLEFTRDTVSDDIMKDLHAELYFLKKSKDILTLSVNQPEQGWFSESEPSAVFVHGEPTGITCPADMAKIDFRNEVCIRVAQKILDGERNDKMTNLGYPVRGNLERIVDDQMSTAEVSSQDVARFAGKIYRSIKDANGTSITDAILSEFACSKRLPDTLIRNDIPVEMTDALTKVFWYFNSRMDDIEQLFDITTASSTNDIKVFNMSISAFLQRNPNYLEYVSQEWFKYLTGNRSASILQSTVMEYKHNLAVLESAVSQIVVAEEFNQDTTTSNDYSNYPVTMFLPNASEYSLQEIQELNDIYEHITKLTPEMISQKIGISQDDYLAIMKPACNVGVCGLNNQTEGLFIDSLKNMVISDGFTCIKSREFLQQINQCITNAKSMLANILPLGQPI